MAEVLALVASIVGIADVGCKLSISLYKYSHAIATRGESVKKISSEVALLSNVLDQLGSNLKDDGYVRMCKPETFKTANVITKECESAFEEVRVTIAGYVEGGKMGLMDRLKWPHVEKKVVLLRTNIECLKSTLILMLEVIGHARSVQLHGPNYDRGDHDIIVALNRENLKMREKYESLLKDKESTGSSIGYAFSNLSVSTINTTGSESRSHPYVVMGISGDLRNDLALKLGTISKLISEVEETQKDLGEVTDKSGIWETFVGTGEHHFRHTEITRHPRVPEMERVEGIRDLESQRSTAGEFFNINRFTWQSDAATLVAPIRDVYIALMGAVGAGKSTFVNLCCGENLAPTSQGPGHCTEAIEAYHFMYTPEIRVHLIDTPGFAQGHRSDREILLDLVEWVDKSPVAVARLSGVIYFHKLSDSTRHGTVHRNLRIFEKLCGADPLHSVIMVITSWDFLGDLEAAMLREEELQTHDDHWGLMVKRGSSVLRHTGDSESAMRILGTFVPSESTKPAFDHEVEPLEHATQSADRAMEPVYRAMEPQDRRRGFSESRINVDFQSAEAEVNQLLAEYTTLFDSPPAQHRRWTLDHVY